MKVISLFLLLILNEAFACSLNSKHEYYSLSSPMTMLFEQLDLLDQLDAVSSFHPVLDKKIKKLAGGIFLSAKAFKKVNSKKNKIIFFDQSMEMRRSLSKVKGAQVLEVFTRKLGAFEAYEVSKEIASSFLIGCDKKISFLDKKVLKIKKELMKKKFSQTVLFYLGKFERFKKDPELLITGDGFVKDLKDFSELKTYPSPLEYVTWSQKIMNKLPSNHFKLSISDYSKEPIQVEKMGENKLSIQFRGALSPGIRQVYLIQELLSIL